jgi:hypothetical protein
MSAVETGFKHLKLWIRPQDYFGQTYHDYYEVAGVHRDSCVIARSNWRCWEKMLKALNIPDVKNPYYDPDAGPQAKGPDGNPLVDEEIVGLIIARSRHWAVGWVEVMLVHKNVPVEVLRKIDEQLAKLDNYPVMDEQDWSQLQNEEFEEAWKNFAAAEFARQLTRKFDLDDLAADLLNTRDLSGFFHDRTQDCGADDGDGNPNVTEAVKNTDRAQMAAWLWRLRKEKPSTQDTP